MKSDVMNLTLTDRSSWQGGDQARGGVRVREDQRSVADRQTYMVAADLCFIYTGHLGTCEGERQVET